ncbi:Uncharacterised protein [Agrobacterium tumefaciens]|nr:Uncharacterised protein [Agrobacterium tumefaciens]
MLPSRNLIAVFPCLLLTLFNTALPYTIDFHGFSAAIHEQVAEAGNGNGGGNGGGGGSGGNGGVAGTEAATVTVAATAMVIQAAREIVTASRRAPEMLRKARPVSTTRRMEVAVL